MSYGKVRILGRNFKVPYLTATLNYPPEGPIPKVGTLFPHPFTDPLGPL